MRLKPKLTSGKCVVLLLLLLSLPLLGWGQQPYFRFKSLKRSALSTDPKIVYPDRFSRLWIGTKEGLYRLDGNAFEKVAVVGKTESTVTAIFQASDGKLWVGYVDGSIRKLKGNQLVRWEPEEGLPVKAITGFAEDGRGQFWVSTYGEGLYCLAKNGRMYNFAPDDGPLQRDVYTICSGPKGRIWAGTDAGVSICTFSEGEKTIETVNGLPDEIVLSLYPDEAGVWVGSHEGGIVYYDRERETYEYPDTSWNSGPIIRMTGGVGKEIFALNQRGELFRARPRDITQITVAPEQKSRLTDLSLDAEGNLWLLDATSGLHAASLRFDFQPIGIEGPQSILKTKGGTTWLGSENGLYRMNGKNEDYVAVSGTEKTNVLCLYEHPDNGSAGETILAGTFGQGLLVCGTEGCRLIREKDGLSNGNILSIDGNGGDTIWLATLGGMSMLKMSSLKDEKPGFKQLNGIAEGFIYQVYCTSNGVVWVATDGDGLLRYEDGKLMRVTLNTPDEQEANIPSTVFSVVPSADEGLWINSQETGLLRYGQGELEKFAAGSYLLDSGEDVSGLLESPSGDLVVVHPQGVSLFLAADSSWLAFGPEMGFTTGSSALNAITNQENGETWLITANQLVKYRSILAARNRPFTKLTAINASGRALGVGDTALNYDENYLVINYEGNWLTDQDAVSFRYWLKGHDQEWITSTDNQVNYSNLAPGNYSFWLESGLNDQFDGKPDLIHNFSISPPWWLRWWSIAGLATLSGLAFFRINRWQRRRRAGMLLLEKERVQNELAALKAQINPHFLFNSFSTLIATIEQSPENAVAYVEQLAAFFRKVLSVRQTDLLPLTEELELAQNYFYLLGKRFGNKLQLKVDCEDTSGHLPPMSLQILVENAVKHNVVSRNRPMVIEITRKDTWLIVRNPVSPKRKPEVSTGFGLSAIRRRYQLLGLEKIRIDEKDGHFSVHLPIL